MERFGAQGVSFIVSIILARRLGPEVYGLVAKVIVFTSIVEVFVNCGLNDALIQKKDADDLDFSTVFYFNIFMCLTLYGIMFLAAPLVAQIYHEPALIGPFRGLSLILVFGGIKNVQVAYVSRHLIFRHFFFATLIGTITAAVVGIWMVFNGYGVWALIVQNLVNTTIDTLILWITVRWRPIKAFSLKRLKELFSYAWKLLVSSLVDTVFRRLNQLVIGLKYANEDLAYYNKGDTMPSLLVTNLNASMNSVLLPVMSEAQEQRERVRAMTRRSIRMSTFVIMPMMAGLAAIAQPTVRLLLGEAWMPSVPFLQIFSFIYAFYSLDTANLNAIKALGRSDLFLKLEIIKKTFGILTLLAMALGGIFTCITGQIINAWPNKRLLSYSYREQLKDMLPNISLSLLMGALVWVVQFLSLPDLITLLIQIPLGLMIYAGTAWMIKSENLNYFLSVLRREKKSKEEEVRP